MEIYNPRIRSLLRQAERVSGAGKRSAAERLYRQIIDEAPETALAWQGLARVASDPSEREAALSRARSLDPTIEDDVGVTGLEQGDKSRSTGVRLSSELHSATHQENIVAESLIDEREPLPDTDPVVTSIVTDKGLSDPASDHLDHPIEEISDAGGKYRCDNHPGRVTSLRCNRCGKPICSKCARPTPVGYRCPQCIREQEDVYFSARPVDYVIASVISIPLALVGAMLAIRLGSMAWGILMILVAPAVGSIIGRIVFRAIGRRRGRWTPHLVGGAVVLGGIVVASPTLLLLLRGGSNLLGLLFIGLYIVMASSSAYFRMK